MEEECWKQDFLNPSHDSGKEHCPSEATNHTGYTGNTNLGSLHTSSLTGQRPSLLTLFQLCFLLT